jgi:hypothetical protein
MSGPKRLRQTSGPDPPACSGRLPVVEAQEPADALAADDLSGARGIGWRLDEPPIEALVIALSVVVGDVFSDRGSDMVRAQQHELVESLALMRPARFRWFDGPAG